MSYLIIFLISIFFSIVLNITFRKIGYKYKLCDQPNKEDFKIHLKPTPFLGGISIFFAFILSLALSAFIYHVVIDKLRLIVVISGSVFFLILGYWDDMKWTKTILSTAKIKFIVQIIIVLLLTIGFVLVNMKIKFFPFLAFEIVLTWLYILGFVNALNITDGLDGLAAGLVIISLIGFAILSILSQNTFCLILSIPLLGAVAGFLIFNWHPASIFMGDSGSYFLGFILATFVIIFTSEPYNFKYLIGPILILGVPVFEMAYTILRRIIIGRSLFLGDREHLYDKIYKKNASTKKTVAIFYFVQVLSVSLGIVIYYARY